MIVPNHLSPHHPRRRALQVLADCDIGEPPVDEQRALDYFGAEVDRTPMCDVPGCKTLAASGRRPSGILQRGSDGDSPSLWVDPAVTPGRFRWTVFHELGHHDLGHEATLFTDDDHTLGPAEGRPELLPTDYRVAGYQEVIPELVDAYDEVVVPIRLETSESIRRKRDERQANIYAGEMIMPSQWFMPAARDLPVGMAAVETLSKRFQASFEATAIRYAQACPDKCAVIAVEPIRDSAGDFSGFTVLYCRRGERGFLRGVRQGVQLPFSGLFAMAWDASGHIGGIVSGGLLGLNRRFELSADALKLGSYGRVVALLWLESGQLTMLAEEA